MPKFVKRGRLRAFKNTVCCKITKKNEEGTLEDIKKVSKKVSQSRKEKRKGSPFSLTRFVISVFA